MSAATDKHHYQTLITLFESTFYRTFNTRLVKGNDEPIYLPSNEQCEFNQIVFAHGFFASALHEIAHWCVAGEQRRTQVDFGYWYCPDGRNAEQQAQFEQVEIKPQALEWCFSVACAFPFKVSVDNLAGEAGDRFAFQAKVYEQVQHYMQVGLPTRAAQFVKALRQHYHTPELRIQEFRWQAQQQAITA